MAGDTLTLRAVKPVLTAEDFDFLSIPPFREGTCSASNGVPIADEKVSHEPQREVENKVRVKRRIDDAVPLQGQDLTSIHREERQEHQVQKRARVNHSGRNDGANTVAATDGSTSFYGGMSTLQNGGVAEASSSASAPALLGDAPSSLAEVGKEQARRGRGRGRGKSSTAKEQKAGKERGSGRGKPLDKSEIGNKGERGRGRGRGRGADRGRGRGAAQQKSQKSLAASLIDGPQASKEAAASKATDAQRGPSVQSPDGATEKIPGSQGGLASLFALPAETSFTSSFSPPSFSFAPSFNVPAFSLSSTADIAAPSSSGFSEAVSIDPLRKESSSEERLDEEIISMFERKISESGEERKRGKKKGGSAVAVEGVLSSEIRKPKRYLRVDSLSGNLGRDPAYVARVQKEGGMYPFLRRRAWQRIRLCEETSLVCVRTASDTEDEGDEILKLRTGQKPCIFYLKGHCAKGEECPFPHIGTPKEMDVCKYFLSGVCSKGESCPYKHAQRPPCRYYHALGFCRDGETCLYSHAPIDAAQKEEIVKEMEEWKAKQAPGTLKTETTPQSPRALLREQAVVSSCSSSAGLQAKATDVPSQAKVPCRFYHLMGDCSKGDACRFSHDPLSEAELAALAKENKTWRATV